MRFDRNINDYEFKCNQVKGQMQAKFNKIDKILNCKGKSSLYAQLEQNMDRILYKDDS